MDGVSSRDVLLVISEYGSIVIGEDSGPYLEFPGATEDGGTEGPGTVDEEENEAFPFEVGVTVGGVALEESVSPSAAHL